MTEASVKTLSSDVEKTGKEASFQFPPAKNGAKGDADTDSPTKLESGEDPFLVGLDVEEDPRNMPRFRKWLIMFVVCTGALCSTCSTSMAAFAEGGVSRDLHVSKEVAILGVSLSIGGIAFGPLFVGPLSEVYGRNPVYRISYFLFFVFCWPVAFAPNIGVYLTFRFVTGFFSSAFLSVAGGSVSDLYQRHETAVPMAVYALAPFIGPMLGPLISGFINQNTSWRWTFRLLIIWSFVEWLMIILVIPETYEPALLKHKAAKLRKATGESRYFAPLDRRQMSLPRAILVSCYTPFQILMFDRMNLLLDLWTAILFGILYLAFQAWPIIFGVTHGFNLQDTGLAFIGIGIGMTAGCLCNVALIRYTQKKHAGVDVPPEALLLTGRVGAIIVPASLFWLAFTTYKHVHWIAPIIASVAFGIGFLLCFTSTFTYLVSAYRPMAASVMAANAFVRSVFAAAFPLFAGQMYARMGTVGATAFLAGIMTVAAPLPFIFHHVGARLRAKSPYATH